MVFAFQKEEEELKFWGAINVSRERGKFSGVMTLKLFTKEN